MYRLFALSLILMFNSLAHAQFRAENRQLQSPSLDLGLRSDGQLSKKSPSSPKQCGQDTLIYARYKSSGLGLTGVSILDGYALGQYFEAPDTVTVSGLRFYAWVTQTTSDSVPIYCEIYASTSDSLPTGSPIRSDTIYVDTSQSNIITDFQYDAHFAPYKTTQPYILVVRSEDTTRVAVVCTDYSRNAGMRESLACGSVGGVWYNSLNLNIGGRTLDCDIVLEPFVDYKIYSHFSVENCYIYLDTVFLKNESSPFLFSRMHNFYALRNFERFSHRWDFGSGFFQYGQTADAFTRYSVPQNRKLRLISTQFLLSSGQCVDTTEFDLYYKPNVLNIQGIKNPLCTGDSMVIRSGGNAEVRWYDQFQDTTPFFKGFDYATGPVFKGDTLYARSYNGPCITPTARIQYKVTTKPTISSILNDSVCANSKANLSAISSEGTIRWYNDSTSSTFIKEGDFIQIGPLNSDSSLFAQAFNKGCLSDGRVKVTALVSNDFAPSDPITKGDTVVCRSDDQLVISASSSNTLRWYSVPSGGQPISTGPTLEYTPSLPMDTFFYVDAFDGNCASSRLPYRIQVDHFDEVTDFSAEECLGTLVPLDYNDLEGELAWYDSDTNFLYNVKYNLVVEPGVTTFFVRPFEGNCRDTMLHRIQVTINELPTIVVEENKGACPGTSGFVRIKDNDGTYEWYNTGDDLINSGPSFTSERLFLPLSIKIKAIENGCESDTSISVKVLKIPNSNFDYSIIEWRRVQFEARDKNLASYNWDMDDNNAFYSVPSFEYTFSQDGDFAVTLIGTNSDGCSDTISKPVSLDTYSIGELENDINIFPNPVSDILSIQLGSSQLTGIRIYDSYGRLISEQDATNSVDVSGLRSGAYFIQLDCEKGIITKSFIRP